MEIPIFPNCSYFLSLGGSAEIKKYLNNAIALHGGRTFFCLDCLDLERTSKYMRQISGLFILSDGLTEADLVRAIGFANLNSILAIIISSGQRAAEPLGPPVYIFSLSEGFEGLKAIVDKFVSTMVPKGLIPVMVEAANRVIPNIIPGVEKFDATFACEIISTRQINFSLAGGNLVGYSATLVNLEEVAGLLPESRQNQALEDVQEALNQCIGLIMQNLAKLGLNIKQGLPSLFDTTRVPKIETMVFFPSVRIVDSKHRIHISLGFVDLAKAPLFDLSSASNEAPAEEIEFL